MNEAHVMPPVAATMKAELAEVQETARLRQGGAPLFTVGDKVFVMNRWPMWMPPSLKYLPCLLSKVMRIPP
ncbi:hypothetical protein KUH03_12025 [Sphingobacterium sp. E70]|uniref:hypothetical protein n=1 Tax=Sphingobacterium sp. E70 TaxID=2853439 RepID=UPI00211CC0F3|nr:hypothetical protein [Sphingobacterium sp. E70]ULT27405.1 hypothetical protein KUH03_12025 [Sphingobacterium sp. E70]